MSAVKTIGYRVEDTRRAVHSPFRFAVMCDESFEGSYYGWPVDHFRSEAAAHYSARILNEGRATIDDHAPVGCKVMPV